MTALERLQAARSLIAQGWTQHATARRANDRAAVPAYDSEAVSFCAAGALLATDDLGLGGGALETCGPLLIKNLPAPATERHVDLIRVITDFNDHPRTTQADVLALYDHTTEKAEAAIIMWLIRDYRDSKVHPHCNWDHLKEGS